MYKLKYLTAILIAVAGLGFQQAQAHLLDPFEFTNNSPFGSPLAERIFLQTHGGGSYQPTFLPNTSNFLFKVNNDGTTDGLFGQFFTVTQTTNTSWDISWNLTGSGFTLDGALIKDGNLGGQLYSFYGISADETLIGSGTVSFTSGRQISHISFFGSPGGHVPDGGTTVMLLGTALGSLGMARRFLKK